MESFVFFLGYSHPRSSLTLSHVTASNEFFYQFPNCLAYEDLGDCVTKLQYALSNKPEPLDDKTAHILSWDGATERLYEASRISTAEEEEYRKNFALADDKAARFHVDGAIHSQKLRNLINDKNKNKNTTQKKTPQHKQKTKKQSQSQHCELNCTFNIKKKRDVNTNIVVFLF